jgi:hypothetical protein
MEAEDILVLEVSDSELLELEEGIQQEILEEVLEKEKENLSFDNQAELEILNFVENARRIPVVIGGKVQKLKRKRRRNRANKKKVE